jgi:putative toxin-antitoxin system antitoxin component (TIGR02293 family)
MATLAHPVAPSPQVALLPIDIAAVESGLPLETLTGFLASTGLELRDIYDVVIPARTLSHRRAKGESLSSDESDKLARLIRIFTQASEVFGSEEKVRRFLREPKPRFDGRAPLQLMRTEVGGRMVEDLLWGIADGVFV